jgi:malonyl-CoA/methylmalonyl-CoA synthetase
MSQTAQRPAWAGHLPAGLDVAAVDLLAGESLTRSWQRRWSERPAFPLLRDLDGTWISCEELEERTRAKALALLAAGVVPGARLLLSASTSAEFVVAYVAALRAGAVVVPLNPAYTETEVARVVCDARPAAAVVDDSERAEWIRAAAERPIPIWGVDLDLPAGSDAPLDRSATDDPALLIYTSGTTGRPKGAPLTHGNLLASAAALNLAWRWDPDDRLLLTLPLFHLHGLGVGINGSLCAGAAIVLRAKFDVDDVADHCAGGVSLFFGVPAMFQRLAESGRMGAMRELRLLVSGSAPLPAALANEIEAAAGQVPLERYGMTETVMLTSNPYEGPRRPGTVGFPLPGVDVRLDESGEVEVRGPNVIAGYRERPDANAEAFTADGWFRTGDLGEIGEDGYLTLVGRSKDLIITGGFNVHPLEVEEVLEQHPGVREVAVVGRPSDRWGEEVTAVVVADRPVDAEQLRADAARRLAPYKVPKTIEFAGELPRNALGKLQRNELR